MKMKIRDLVALPFILVGFGFFMIGIWIGGKFTAWNLRYGFMKSWK